MAAQEQAPTTAEAKQTTIVKTDKEATQERATFIIEAEQQTTYSAKTDEVAAREQAPTVEAEQTTEAKANGRQHKCERLQSRRS